MSLDPLPARSNLSVHVPLAALALSIAIFLGVQIRASSALSDTLRKQITNAEEQKKQLGELESRYKAQAEKNKPTMDTAKTIYQNGEKFLTEVLNFAKDDQDTRDVMNALGIQLRQPDAAAAPAATPAPAAR